jgi:hypothetical protein
MKKFLTVLFTLWLSVIPILSLTSASDFPIWFQYFVEVYFLGLPILVFSFMFYKLLSLLLD